jgi:hypothetical protein
MRGPQGCPSNIYRMYWPSMPELFDSPRKASNANAGTRQALDDFSGTQRRPPSNSGAYANWRASAWEPSAAA